MGPLVVKPPHFNSLLAVCDFLITSHTGTVNVNECKASYDRPCAPIYMALGFGQMPEDAAQVEVKNAEVETPTLREVFLAQPLNPLVPLVFNVVPTREVSNATNRP